MYNMDDDGDDDTYKYDDFSVLFAHFIQTNQN